MVRTIVTSLLTLVIGAALTAVVLLNVTDENNEGQAESIDDIVEHSYDSPEITTDLQSGNFVRIQFKLLTDSDAAREEIGKRDFQLKNILIKELATMDEEDFKSDLSELEDIVKSRLNEVMSEGNITDVYTINKIMQ
ncbi:flagellar FliL protein [Virgibacillus natechei]|uniref:Flagellar protein FliL n=1 Tax=Virgibacillus natechei TaxID=1216297 RepID=A0ABS4IB71_9BACI|nr:flagellar basal body-associated FliL family protein [Virgibacillus natechei]MBP1968093.1 flagellar FliL protein [Virgibacillus natechei]